MIKKIELLAPGGDLDSIKAAIAAGADAIYCGLNRFNARNRAANISIEDLHEVLRLAHANNCQVFLTLNIIIVEDEIRSFVGLLNKLVNTGIDGIILQDLGMLYLVSTYFKSLKIHASTQLTTHNSGQIHFLSNLAVTRVNLSRELNLGEIKKLAAAGHSKGILTEVFVHGSNCISFSGLCYMSSVFDGKSGNRGRCSQPCRDEYLTTPQGKSYPLNLKDNTAYSDLAELADAGVDSIKIEGRIKKFHYVYTIVKSWNEQLSNLYNYRPLNTDKTVLHSVFNRDFTNAFLKGDISKSMFIDNPRDNSAIHRSESHGGINEKNVARAKREIYDERTELIESVRDKIESLTIEKVPLLYSISGQHGSRLKLCVQTPNDSFSVVSKSNLVESATPGVLPYTDNQRPDEQTLGKMGNEALSKKEKKHLSICLNHVSLLEHLAYAGNTDYYISDLEVENLDSNLSLPFADLTAIKKRIAFYLNGSKKPIPPVELPQIKTHEDPKIKPTLAVLISSRKDLELCKTTSADFYYQLPNYIGKELSSFVELFRSTTHLTPWFPSILIGNEYTNAVELLRQVEPKRIVTNNTGIAYEASKRGISWIAGPYLNIANSYCLLYLQKLPNCSGAFISNELNRFQVKIIKQPEGFNLYYSIYHPILLMKSRQCLFHQVIGCTKPSMDDDCLTNCDQSASITRLNDTPLYINKSAGNLNCIYNSENYLNTDVVTNPPNTFSSFFIDLREIETETTVTTDKQGILKKFERLINGDSCSQTEIVEIFQNTTNSQYTKGI